MPRPRRYPDGRDAGLLAALDAVHAAELARRLSMNHAALSRWRRVPQDRIVQVERETGVPREVLRPDLYGPREGL